MKYFAFLLAFLAPVVAFGHSSSSHTTHSYNHGYNNVNPYNTYDNNRYQEPANYYFCQNAVTGRQTSVPLGLRAASYRQNEAWNYDIDSTNPYYNRDLYRNAIAVNGETDFDRCFNIHVEAGARTQVVPHSNQQYVAPTRTYVAPRAVVRPTATHYAPQKVHSRTIPYRIQPKTYTRTKMTRKAYHTHLHTHQ